MLFGSFWRFGEDAEILDDGRTTHVNVDDDVAPGHLAVLVTHRGVSALSVGGRHACDLTFCMLHLGLVC